MSRLQHRVVIFYSILTLAAYNRANLLLGMFSLSTPMTLIFIFYTTHIFCISETESHLLQLRLSLSRAIKQFFISYSIHTLDQWFNTHTVCRQRSLLWRRSWTLAHPAGRWGRRGWSWDCSRSRLCTLPATSSVLQSCHVARHLSETLHPVDTD